MELIYLWIPCQTWTRCQRML